jgi:adenylate cyclase
MTISFETLGQSLHLMSLLNVVANKILESQYNCHLDDTCYSSNIWQTIIDTISQALDVDLAILELFEPREDSDRYLSYQNLKGTSSKPIDTKILQLTVWKTNEIRIIKDVKQETRFSRGNLSNQRISLAYQQADIRTTLLVPFISQLKLIGVLALHRCQTLSIWEEEEIQFITAIASQAVLAISQIQAYEKLTALARRESMVNTIATAIRSSLEPEKIFAAIVQQLGKALGVDSCSLSLWNKTDKFVECVGLYSPNESITVKQAQSIVPIAENPILQKLLKTFKPVVLNDLKQARDLARYDLPLRSPARALLIVPLIVDGELIGSITLSQRKGSRNWHRQEMDLAEAVATQAAIAVQQARLYETTRKQAELLQESEQKVKKLNTYLTESVLKRFLPKTLVDRVAAGELVLDLTPEPAIVTVLYTDLVSFTQLSERLGAKLTATILNQYLEAMTKVVFECGGAVDKFIGDGLMALFGAPETLAPQQQARRAIAAARLMYRSLEGLNQAWQEEKIFSKNNSMPLRFRCGINQGTAVVGMFGGEQRSDYTAIGSAVNIAARLQEVAAANQILVSGAIASYLEEGEIKQSQFFQLKGIEGDIPGFYITIE